MILIEMDDDDQLDVVDYTFILGCWDLDRLVT